VRSLLSGHGVDEEAGGTYGEVAGHINTAIQAYKGLQEGWGFAKTHFGYTIAVTDAQTKAEKALAACQAKDTTENTSSELCSGAQKVLDDALAGG